MRVVLVGPATRRDRAKLELPDTISIVGETASLSAGRIAASASNAFVLLIPEQEVDEPLFEALTPREREVLELVAGGLSNKAIAGALGVSDETVKFHLSSIFGKLGASNRTDAVRIALRHGLVTL
jgi:DNA-binding NarL/FixJ family response regulator